MTSNEQKILYAKKFFSAVINNYEKFSNDELLFFCITLLKNVIQKTFFEEEVYFFLIYFSLNI